MGENKYGFDEVVDWSADVIEVTSDVREALSDGVQLGDAFVLLKNQGKLTEVVRDADEFFKQLLDLTPEESDQAIAQIAERTGVDTDKVNATIVFGMQIASRCYRLIDYNVQEFNAIKGDVQRFALMVQGEAAA
jgi:hypothetical protein